VETGLYSNECERREWTVSLRRGTQVQSLIIHTWHCILQFTSIVLHVIVACEWMSASGFIDSLRSPTKCHSLSRSTHIITAAVSIHVSQKQRPYRLLFFWITPSKNHPISMIFDTRYSHKIWHLTIRNLPTSLFFLWLHTTLRSVKSRISTMKYFHTVCAYALKYSGGTWNFSFCSLLSGEHKLCTHFLTIWNSLAAFVRYDNLGATWWRFTNMFHALESVFFPYSKRCKPCQMQVPPASMTQRLERMLNLFISL